MMQDVYNNVEVDTMYVFQESIRTSADLRNHYNEISKQCREEYNRMNARIELLEILAESDEDVKLGRVAPIKDIFDKLRRDKDILSSY